MKKVFIIVTCLFLSTSINAQITDDFENNNFGWTESVSSKYEAVIKEGHLHLEGKTEGAISACYAPFDYNKPFELKCEAFVKSLSGSKHFGILLDYEDDINFTKFDIEDDKVYVNHVVEGRVVGYRVADLKLKSKKKTGVDFKIEYSLQKITMYINDMKAIDYQRRLPKDQYMLGTTGIGFYAGKNTMVDFDNLQIAQ